MGKPEIIKAWNEYKRRYGPDCICTVEQVKNNYYDSACDWCNAGFDCNPDLSDPEVYEDEKGVR